MTSLWESTGLWEKAKLCVQRGQTEAPDSTERALWDVLALEFVARAALANIHPVLLADPQDGKNVLYAFGVSTDNPRSVPARTVFTRCAVLVSGFSDADARLCVSLADRRNEELHSAGLAFETFPIRAWLADYYRVIDPLALSLGRDLEELFGPEEASSARTMISERAEQFIEEVRRSIEDARAAWDSLSEPDRAMRVALADEDWLRVEKRRQYSSATYEAFAKKIACPACGSSAVLIGQRIRKTGESFDDEEHKVVETWAALPIGVECKACGLLLEGHARTSAADLGGEYLVQHRFDPIDYYGIEVDPSEFFDEEDYGND